MHGTLHVKYRKIVWNFLFNKLPVAKKFKCFAVNHLYQRSETPLHFILLSYWSCFNHRIGPDTRLVYSFVLLFIRFWFLLDNIEKFWVIVLKWSVVIRGLFIQGETLKGVISSPAKKKKYKFAFKIDIYLKHLHSVIMLRLTAFEKITIKLSVPINYCKFKGKMWDCNGVLYPWRENSKCQGYWFVLFWK
jgi:hypothetical protein